MHEITGPGLSTIACCKQLKSTLLTIFLVLTKQASSSNNISFNINDEHQPRSFRQSTSRTQHWLPHRCRMRTI